MLELFEKCELCPRKCGVNRIKGETGFCKMPALPIKVARVGLHMWEEPCISGETGSGTVFFTGCNLKCVFCQNEAISRGLGGRDYTIEELGEAFISLQNMGANNINLVTPTHYMPAIAEAIIYAKKRTENSLTIPVVYNCGGYELPESIEKLGGLVDIFMPDVKYHSKVLSEKYSKAPDYFTYAMDSLESMVKTAGTPIFKDGLMKSGVLVRHLILPTRTEDSMKILRALWHRFGNNIYLSLMNQYTPMKRFEDFPELSISLSQSSYDRVIDYALSLGFDNINIQKGGTVSQSFIPPFDI